MSISRYDGEMLISMIGEGVTTLAWDATGPDVSVCVCKYVECVYVCVYV